MSDAPFPSFTKKWHNTPYETINPTRPELSVKDKTIVVTGGGRGIGKNIVRAYAQAGAAFIGVTGRTEATLETIRQSIETAFPNTQILTAVADVSDFAAVDAAFKKFNEAVSGGGIDILIQNAGLFPKARKISEIDTPELLASWWQGWEVNVLGLAVIAQAFVKYKSANDPKFINIGTAATAFDPLPRFSGYNSSKFANAHVLQYFADENPSLKIYNLHPGVVITDMGKVDIEEGLVLPQDDIDLAAHFAVWIASEEAEFLEGARLVYCNWDVNELLARKDEYLNKIKKDGHFGKVALVQSFAPAITA